MMQMLSHDINISHRSTKGQYFAWLIAEEPKTRKIYLHHIWCVDRYWLTRSTFDEKCDL